MPLQVVSEKRKYQVMTDQITRVREDNKIQSLIISILLHISLISTFSLFVIPLESMKPNEQQKIKFIKRPKIIGEKKSKEENFQLPSYKPPEPLKDPSELDFSKLRPDPRKVVEQKEVKEQDIGKKIQPNSVGKVQVKKGIQATPEMKRQVRTEVQTTPQQKQMLQNKDFNMEFTPPKGVPENELNSFEKIYYAFLKRTYQKYVNSFITNYNKMTTERPYLRGEIENGRHAIRGRITFDRDGNPISIKITNVQSGDGVYDLFEETLKGIGSLTNPPKAFIQDQDEFSVYFVLRVN